MDCVNESFPLTLTQTDILFDQFKHPCSPLYTVGGYLKLGFIEVQKLGAAHKLLIEKEEVFGLRLKQSDSRVEQYISDNRDTSLQLDDFSSKSNPEESAEGFLRHLFETPFELFDAPLFKSCLLKLSSDYFIYVGASHHIAMDGWAFQNWVRRLCQLYNGIDGFFGDVGDWLAVSLDDKKYLMSQKYQLDREYWKNQNINSGDKLLFPVSLHHKSSSKYSPNKSKKISVSSDSLNAISLFAKKHKVNNSHVFLGLFATYFSLAYSKEELMFGLPIHKRKTFKQKQMLGSFSSVSPLKVDIPGDSTFSELVIEIATQQKANLRRQNYPIGHIIRDSQFSGKHENIYSIEFNYLTLVSELNFEGTGAHTVEQSSNHENTPIMITVYIYPEINNAEIQLSYLPKYFSDSEVELMVSRFDCILEQAILNPYLCIESLAYIPSEERDYLLHELNDTQVDYPQDMLIHELFEAQASRTPDNVALMFEEAQLTYRELNEASNRLAHYLREQGVVADTLVGICVERSIEMVIGVLGVLKSGGAYVPLDPSYPKARLAYMLSDTGLKHLLTQPYVRAAMDIAEAVNVMELDTPEMTDELLRYPIVNPKRRAEQSSSDLAYVI